MTERSRPQDAKRMGPLGPSNTYSFSTFSIGSSRRACLSASRWRVNSFSLASSFLRAGSHSSCATIFGTFMLLFPSRGGFWVIAVQTPCNSGLSTKLLHQQCGEPGCSWCAGRYQGHRCHANRAHRFAPLRVQSLLARIAFTHLSKCAPEPEPDRDRIHATSRCRRPTGRRGAGVQSLSTTRSTVPLIFREVLVDSDQPPALSSWSLKVEVGVRYREHLDAESDNLLPHFFDVVGPQLQIESPSRSRHHSGRPPGHSSRPYPPPARLPSRREMRCGRLRFESRPCLPTPF